MKLRHVEKLLKYKDILDAHNNDFHLIAYKLSTNEFGMDRKTIEDFIDTFFLNLKPFQTYFSMYLTPYLIKKYENQLNFYILSTSNVRIPNEIVLRHHKELNWEAMYVAGAMIYDDNFWKFCKQYNIIPPFLEKKLIF